MTTKSGPGGGRTDPGLDAITSERRQLINVAYRLLGSLAEAEDAVQEAYARWYAMSRQEQQAIRNPGAWLTTVASRICLNMLGSAHARRETSTGVWRPEPLPDPADLRVVWSHARLVVAKCRRQGARTLGDEVVTRLTFRDSWLAGRGRRSR